MPSTFNDIQTQAVRSGEPEPRINGAITMPIFQTAMFESVSEVGYDLIPYIRLNNTPNQMAVAEKLAALEKAPAAVVTSSGMAAISTALLTVLSAGDHLLIQNCLYGGTHYLVTEDLPSFDIAFDFIDASDPRSWMEKLRPNTRAIYLETISNPLLQVPDVGAAVEFARSHGLVSMIDNTFASPVNFRPCELGIDLTLHSATKYLNGHSDIVAGACIGRTELVDRVRRRLNHLGGALDPHAAFLLQRGIKTLVLRVERQNATALKLARLLERHAEVARVHYPGLETDPEHRMAAALFDGFGGILSFELKGGVGAAKTFLERVELPINAVSLGGVETLITRPAVTTHSAMSPEDRQRLGISDSLLRVSVGIESAAELLEDFEHALG